MATILYFPKTIIDCSRCGESWVFPSHQQCPKCGEEVQIAPLDDSVSSHLVYAPLPAQPRDDLQKRHVEPDGGSKALVYVGIGVCFLLIANAYWDEFLLVPVMHSLGIPSVLLPLVRLVLFLIGGIGSCRGVMSLLGWYSGLRVYRRLRF